MLLVQGGVESRNMRGDGSPRRADKERVHTENEGAQIGFGDCHNVPSNVTVAAVGIQTQTHRHRSTGTRMLVLYSRLPQQFKNSLQVVGKCFLFWGPAATVPFLVIKRSRSARRHMLSDGLGAGQSV